VRLTLNLDAIDDVRPVDDDGSAVRVAVPDGVVRVRVNEETGPTLPASCGADPEPSRRFIAAARW